MNAISLSRFCRLISSRHEHNQGSCSLLFTNHSNEDRLVVLQKIIALETCSQEEEYQWLLETVAQNSYLVVILNVVLIMEKVGEMMDWLYRH